MPLVVITVVVITVVVIMSVIMSVIVSVIMIVMMPRFVHVGANFHVSTAFATAAFLTHIMRSPRRRFQVPARAAARR